MEGDVERLAEAMEEQTVVVEPILGVEQMGVVVPRKVELGELPSMAFSLLPDAEGV